MSFPIIKFFQSVVDGDSLQAYNCLFSQSAVITVTLLGQFPLFITFFLAKRREAHLSHLATMANSGYPYKFATQYAPYAAPPQQAQYAPYVAPPQQAPYDNHMN